MLVEHRKRRRRRRDRGTTARLDTLRETRWRQGVSMAAHELRNSLNAILGWTQVLAEDLEDAAGRQEAVSRIERCAREQARLVDDLAHLARAADGIADGGMRPLDLAAMVGSAVADAAPLARAAGVRMEMAEGDGPVRVVGDAVRLRQVVWNLLTNAVKFTPSGGRVDVRVGRRGGEAAVEVADTGIGIGPELMGRLFEPFEQGRRGGEGAAVGVGLGLAIARRLTEGQGGRLDARSRGEGAGSTFVVRLPALDA